MNEAQPSEDNAGHQTCEATAEEVHVDALNRHWRAQHRKRTRAIVKQLAGAHPDASAVDRLLLGVAAHDLAVGELLADAQVLLASRVSAFVDTPKSLSLVARALAEATSCRKTATARVEQLLQTVATMRAQRALSTSQPKSPHLRRVA